jgi:hypothetical protein
MKTNELTGAALDWAVAQCEGLNPILGSSFERGHADGLDRYPFVYLHEPMKHNIAAPAFYTGYTPSVSWWIGGEIIERERIELVPDEIWNAYKQDQHIPNTGMTPLIAAMRCYVASKLGDDVEVPEEVVLDK